VTEDDLEAALIAAKPKHVIDLLRMDIKGCDGSFGFAQVLAGGVIMYERTDKNVEANYKKCGFVCSTRFGSEIEKVPGGCCISGS